MAMRRPNHFVTIGHTFNELTHTLTPWGWNRIPYSIRHINGGSPRLNHRIEYSYQKIHLRANRIFGREFNIIGIFQRPFHRLYCPFNHLVFSHAEFIFHMNFAGCNKCMNATTRRMFNGFSCASHIILTGTGK